MGNTDMVTETQTFTGTSSNREMTPEMEKAILQIVAFAQDNDGTIDDENIDSFFGNRVLSADEKRNIRLALSDSGVEIVINNNVKPALFDDDEIVDLYEEVTFEKDVAYDRSGSIDGYQQLLRQIRNYPLLLFAQEIAYSQDWQAARAANSVLATIEAAGRNVVGEEDIEPSILPKSPKEDKADYYLPLVGKTDEDLRAIYAKGKESRDKLINSNVRLSINFAKKLSRNHQDFEDLYQAGVEGLIKACDKYEARKGFRFSTYATWWVRQFQTRTRNDQSRCIRIPAHIHEKAVKIRNAANSFIEEYGTDPSTKELAEYVGMKEEDLIQINASTSEILSMDYLVNPEEDGSDYTTLENFVATDESDSPENVAMTREMERKLKACVDDLPGKEAEILCSRLGLFGYPKRTLDEISKSVGITKERVRQIESNAYKALRTPVYKKQLKEYSDFFA